MAKIVLLLGGVRSGKSEYGERLALSLSDRVAYIATGIAVDEEMKRRIEAHKKKRPGSWKTYEFGEDDIETGFRTGKFERIFNDILEKHTEIKVVLVDCITNLLFRIISRYRLDRRLDTKEVLEAEEEAKIEKEILSFFDNFVKTIKDAKENGLNVIVVSNEVGLGIVPFYPLGRVFRDFMGIINKKIAQESDEVYFFIAGLGQRLK